MVFRGGKSVILSLLVVFISAVFARANPAAGSGFAGSRLSRFLSMDDGLPVNFVEDIFMDSSGFLWLATSGGGLCRYDFLAFSTNTSVSVRNNFVRSELVVRCRQAVPDAQDIVQDRRRRSGPRGRLGGFTAREDHRLRRHGEDDEFHLVGQESIRLRSAQCRNRVLLLVGVDPPVELQGVQETVELPPCDECGAYEIV